MLFANPIETKGEQAPQLITAFLFEKIAKYIFKRGGEIDLAYEKISKKGNCA